MPTSDGPRHGRTGKPIDKAKLDRVVTDARQARDQRQAGYREQALKLYPWVCGRCARTFTRANVRELTVHHRDHNHDNNPTDGSNWELLCLYCHDNEHQRHEEHIAAQTATLHAPLHFASRVTVAVGEHDSFHQTVKTG